MQEPQTRGVKLGPIELHWYGERFWFWRFGRLVWFGKVPYGWDHWDIHTGRGWAKRFWWRLAWIHGNGLITI